MTLPNNNDEAKKKLKRVVLGEGYPGKSVLCTMYLWEYDKLGKKHSGLVPLRSFRDLWDKKIRLIA